MSKHEIIPLRKTNATHDKEYRQLEITAWKPYQIKSYLIEECVPAGAVFLTTKIIEGSKDGFIFLVPRPKPRSLPELDNQIELYLSMYFHPEEVSTKSSLKDEILNFLKENVFTTQEEEAWWTSHRSLELKMKKEQIEIDILGGNW